ncbi:DUF551 domain-containing protein [Vibrio breoganii]
MVKISITDELPPANEYVVLWSSDKKAPPTIGWATYWHPQNSFGGFEVSDQAYLEDYGKEFTHWMPLP